MNIKKKILALSLVLTTFVMFGFSQEIVNGYYISSSNDTIYARFLVSDIFQLHNEIIVVDSAEKKLNLKPDDIKGFSFSTKKHLDYSKPCYELSHENDNLLLKTGYLYKRNAFSLDSEIHLDYFFSDSIYNYESCVINSNLSLFLRVRDGLGGRLHADQYYTKLDDSPFFSTIWLLIKDNKAIVRNKAKLKDWLTNCIADYPVLKSMVQKEKIRSFPFDFNIVIDDYNKWSNLPIENRPDTSMTVKGILDADKYYKTTKYFAISSVTGTAFFLPGMVSAVIMAHNPKEKNISIPTSLLNRENAEYSKAFKHRAYEKKYRAAGHGATTGGVLSIGLIILMALL